MGTINRKAHVQVRNDKVVPVKATSYEHEHVGIPLEPEQLKKRDAVKSSISSMALDEHQAKIHTGKPTDQLRESAEELDLFLMHQDSPSPDSYKSVLAMAEKTQKNMKLIVGAAAKLPKEYKNQIYAQMRELQGILNNVILGSHLEQPLAIREIDDQTYNQQADDLVSAVERGKELLRDSADTIDEGLTSKTLPQMKPSRMLRFLYRRSLLAASVYSVGRYGIYFLMGLAGRKPRVGNEQGSAEKVSGPVR